MKNITNKKTRKNKKQDDRLLKHLSPMERRKQEHIREMIAQNYVLNNV